MTRRTRRTAVFHTHLEQKRRCEHEHRREHHKKSRECHQQIRAVPSQ